MLCAMMLLLGVRVARSPPWVETALPPVRAVERGGRVGFLLSEQWREVGGWGFLLSEQWREVEGWGFLLSEQWREVGGFQHYLCGLCHSIAYASPMLPNSEWFTCRLEPSTSSPTKATFLT